MSQLSRRVALLALFALVSFSVACGGSDTKSDATPVETSTQGAGKTRSVVLFGYKFNPTTLTIPVGSTVIFKNQDPERHNVSIAALNVDQNIDPQQEWSYTFETKGDFAVSNRLNNRPMALTIVVE